MSGLSVIVLCPNGRRVTVKITANTSILQILEEACKKEGFNPDEYNLKQLRRVLDTSLSVRHAGIPNRCQLEMVPLAVPRSSAAVTVHIITSAGCKLVHDFPSTASLSEVLQHHESQLPEGEVLLPTPASQQEAVLVYAMRRISGPDLNSTTLRTLGLTGGKCMFRHSIQSVNSEGQANVSSPLAKHNLVRQNEDTEMTTTGEATFCISEEMKQESLDQQQKLHQEQEQLQQNQLLQQKQRLTDEQAQQQVLSMCEAVDMTMDTAVSVLSSQSVNSAVVHSEVDSSYPEVNRGDATVEENDDGIEASSSDDIQPDSTPRVIKVGKQNAIIFSMEDAPPTSAIEENDAFFELSLDEIKRLYMQQKKAIHEMENTPLQTSKMRELEESSRVLSAMNRYPVTYLRVYFPDQHVIQLAFKPTDTVATVMAALRPFLADPTHQFYLCTRHPSRKLVEDMTLVSADCVPNARLYYTSSQSGPPYLSSTSLASKSSFTSACSTMKKRSTRYGSGKSRDENQRHENTTMASPDQPRHLSTTSPANLNSSTGAVPKVPKWFKLGK